MFAKLALLSCFLALIFLQGFSTIAEKRIKGHNRPIRALEDETSIELLGAIGIPLPEGVAWVEGPGGSESEPAFQFSANSDVKKLTTSVVPSSFPTDFAITVTVRPANDKGGVLFAATSEDDSKIYLGLEILPVRGTTSETGEFDGFTTIRFSYLNPYFESNETVSFKVNEFTNRWTRFALSKEGDVITLYFACGAKVERKVAQEVWGAFIIPGNSLFYLGKAGNNPNHNVFEGDIAELRLHQDPNQAKEQCNDSDREDYTGENSGEGAEGTDGGSATGNTPLTDEYTITTVVSTGKVKVDIRAGGSTGRGGNTDTTNPSTSKIEDESTTQETPLVQPTASPTTQNPVQTEAKGTPAPKTKSEAQTTPHTTHEPQVTSEPQTTPTPEIKTTHGPKTTPEPETTPTAELKTTPEPKTTPELKTTPTPELKITLEPKTTPQPTSKPTSKPTTKVPTQPSQSTKIWTENVITNSNKIDGGSGNNVFTPSKNVQTPSESVQTPSESVQTPSESVQTPSESVQTPSENVQTPSGSIQTPSENVPSTEKTTTESNVVPVRTTKTSVTSKPRTVDSHLTDNMIPCSLDTNCDNNNGRGLTQGEKGDTIKGGEGTIDSSDAKGEKGEKGERGDSGPVFTLKPERGEKGERGLQGNKGEVGLDGIPGVSIKGQKGDMGSQGERGEQGLVKIEKGEKGSVGFPGVQGVAGNKGEQGVGKPGPPGIPGTLLTMFNASTRRGPQGLPGPPGPPGKPGSNVNGSKGDLGFPGPKGDKGDTGATGPKGKTGDITNVIGPIGSQGPQGLKGEKGDVLKVEGSEGPKGAPGHKGDAGEKGKEGSPGSDGTPGAPGQSVKGDSGVKGEKGDRGESGIEGKSVVGPQGPPGPPGPPGPIQGFESGGENTNNVGSTAGKKIVDAVKGDQGEQGDRGDRGDVGPSGEKGEKGDSGNAGEMGEQGIAGDKGSQGAVGSKGDEGQQGAKGDIGPAGPSGESIEGGQGAKGDRGQVGPSGKPGDKGDEGQRGIPGDDGKKGENGDTGLIGQPGETGEKGDTGVQGAVGPPGPEGGQGIPGVSVSGNAGPQGPPGPPGPPGKETNSLSGPSDRGDDRGRRDGDKGKTTMLGIVTFYDQDDLTEGGRLTPEGTIAFVLNSQSLFVRHGLGWRSIQYGNEIISVDSAPTAKPTQGVNNLQLPQAGVTASSPHLYLIALNEAMSGDMGGVSGIDHKCWKQSRRAGLRGTFRGFLSSYVQAIKSIVRRRDRKLPVANRNGEQLFPSWEVMFNGEEAFNPDTPILSFDGRDVRKDPRWPLKLIWHGSDSKGNNMEENCDRWNVEAKDSRSKFSYGAPINGTSSVLEPDKFYCYNPFIVLCVQVGVRH